ncbi:DUF3576 domain-containing protein [Rhodovastum atsumiense]|uniref:DUF3576 domain-containing protein n=2 Tax=Rhodovastum atsumiense TaxID=504468 RepID=A0A5M6IQ46_9PROT|nr:DUF3576 domain-containing protein [Rhodovastum atsumiense]
MLAGCKTSPVSETEYNDPRYTGPGQGRAFGSDGLILFGGRSKTPSEEGGSGLGVNAYLWRAALDTLSFMPLASADPFGGVIITDWYQPPSAPGERFKATAYILGRQLRADAVRIAVFRQVQEGGQWVDAPVSAVTTSDIENKVLARARELRTQATGS